MNLKKKLRDFFTLTRKANEGFTLVELIVVIAILAILAGVAVPAYNGYIEKANKAADETLIAAINKAAAAAVLDEMGEDMVLLDDGALSSNADKGKTNFSVWKGSDKAGPVATAFAEYFEDNENAALKWYRGLKFEGGRFVGVEPILYAPLVGDDAAAAAFDASSYKKLGVDGMTDMVDTLAGALSEYEGLNLLTDSTAFEDKLKDMGINPATADAQTKANASVFYLADRMELLGAELGEDQIWQHVKTGDLQTWLTEEGADIGLTANDAIFVSTALRYASATAYAYSTNPSDAAKEIRNANPTSNGEALTIVGRVTGTSALEKAMWNAYTTNEGQSDFNAFFQVMEVVNTNSKNFSSIEGAGLFSSTELQAEINRILKADTP